MAKLEGKIQNFVNLSKNDMIVDDSFLDGIECVIVTKNDVT